MVAYEVQTEDLIQIRDQLAVQAGLVGSTSSGITEATTAMLQQMEVGLGQAQSTIDVLLYELVASVQAADSAAAGADWLGPDSEAFRAANTDLAAAISRSQTQLGAALSDHQAATIQIGATLAATLQRFTAEASRSKELASQLSAVVGAEADSYDRAFDGNRNGNGAESLVGVGATVEAQLPVDVEESDEGFSWRSLGHLALDIGGLVPLVGEPADGINAAWYAAEGDYVNSGLSGAAMIPGFGWGAAAAKFGKRAEDAEKAADGIVDAANAAGDSARAAASTASGASSAIDILKPGGTQIGKPGTNPSIRVLAGSLPDAEAMFKRLSEGGEIVAHNDKLTRVKLPNDGGFVQLRTVMSRSPDSAATIDVNIPGLDITKVKFNHDI